MPDTPPVQKSEEQEPTFIQWHNETAIRVHGLPKEWRWFSFNSSSDVAPDGHAQLKGGVPVGVISRGPRKGMPKWGDDRQTLWITDAQVEETKRLYEEKTGKCANCSGNSVEYAGWHHITGSRYRTCPKCSGTGVVKQ